MAEKVEFKVTVNELKDIVNKVNGQHKDNSIGLFTTSSDLTYKSFYMPKDSLITITYYASRNKYCLSYDNHTSEELDVKDVMYLIHSGKLTSSTKLYKDNKFFTNEFKFNSKDFNMNRNDIQVEGTVYFFIISANHEQVRLFSENDKFIFNVPLEDFISIVVNYNIFIPIKEKELDMFGE